jgi:hypothetical protein
MGKRGREQDFLSQGHVSLSISDAMASSDDPATQNEIFNYLIQMRIDFFEKQNGKNSKPIKLISQKVKYELSLKLLTSSCV